MIRMQTLAAAALAMLTAAVVAAPAQATYVGGGGSKFGSTGGWGSGKTMESNERAGHCFCSAKNPSKKVSGDGGKNGSGKPNQDQSGANQGGGPVSSPPASAASRN